MSSPRENTSRVLRIYQALHLFIHSKEDDALEACDRLRDEIQKKLLKSGKEKSDHLRQVDDAFTQLTQVKSILQSSGSQLKKLAEMSEQGKNLIKQKKYAEAYDIYISIIDDKLTDIEVLTCGATAALYSSHPESAINWSRRILSKSAHEPQALTLLALSHLAQDELDEASYWIDLAHKSRPDSEIIRRYYNSIAELRISQSSQKAKERKWKRALLRRPFIVVDASIGGLQKVHTLSLSGGGCLIEAAQLPEEFQFTLELSPGRHIRGEAMTVYSTRNQSKGILFSRIDRGDQDEINQAILRTLSQKKIF